MEHFSVSNLTRNYVHEFSCHKYAIFLKLLNDSLRDRGLVPDVMRGYNVTDLSKRTDVEMAMACFNIISWHWPGITE